MRINNNISALNSWRNLSNTDRNMDKSLEKLSSGYRINRAGDDAAGLAISEKMRAQVRGLNQATRNAQDGISLIQTAEGALNETHSILQRMRELAVQASNDTLESGDRDAIKAEIDELNLELDRIANATQFNGKVLLNGSFGVKLDSNSGLAVGQDGVSNINVSGANASTTYTITHANDNEVTLSDGTDTQTITALGTFTGTLNFDKFGISIDVVNVDFSDATGSQWTGHGESIITTASAEQNIQIGANTGQTLGLTIDNMTSTALGTDAITLNDSTEAGTAITLIDSAIKAVSDQRSKLGAWQNRLEHTINNLGVSAENLTAAESRIRDVDMALEMAEFTKHNILLQAGTSMLAQANSKPQNVLQLLG